MKMQFISTASHLIHPVHLFLAAFLDANLDFSTRTNVGHWSFDQLQSV